MAITKKSNRQDILSATVDINFGDITSGVAASAIELPIGAVVVGGFLAAITAFNSATSDVAVITAPNADVLMASASIHVVGYVGVMATSGKEMTTVGNVTITWTGVGAAPTAGKARLTVNYIVIGRSMTNQG
jgi:hypothetical protein